MTDPVHSDRGVQLYHADCLEVLRDLDDASVDAVVTDPPYGLSDLRPDAVVTAITAWANGDREQVPDARGFMGRSWDSFVPPPAVWDECLRVLKPGGHLAAFAGSRTYDLMGLSIRMAGFEIRDGLQWLYGAGFPKGLDVSKAIDKAAGAEREVVGLNPRAAQQTASIGTAAYGDYSAAPAFLTASATDEARRWEGWNTSLKPAHEPIVLARKPLDGTVAANVLAHGTGAINIGACRVGYASPADRAQAAVPQPAFGVKADGAGTFNHRAGEGRNGERFDPGAGRWPANVLLDDVAAAELDRQSGERPGMQPGVLRRGATTGRSIGGASAYGAADPQDVVAGYGDTGGASRFFPTFRYEAKAPTSERPMVGGVAHPTVKPVALMAWLVRLLTPPGGLVLDPFAGTGTTGLAAAMQGFRAVLVERDDEHIPLIVARLQRKPREARPDTTPTTRPDDGQSDLFDFPMGDTA